MARSTAELPGFRPRKLGHTNFLTDDLAAQTAFYTDVLGMRISDRLGDAGVWLHVNADHHVLAFVAKGYAHLHHLALELVDWGELRVAFDHLAQHGRWLAWGPLRHGLGRNLSGYVRIPEEKCFVEFFADMEQLGAAQRAWLLDGLRASDATWKFVANLRIAPTAIPSLIFWFFSRAVRRIVVESSFFSTILVCTGMPAESIQTSAYL